MTFLNHLLNLQEIAGLERFSLQDLFLFVRAARLLVDDILTVQPAAISTDSPPAHLPPCILLFLSEIISISQDAVSALWSALCCDIWALNLQFDSPRYLDQLFQRHGWKLGLTALALYPPSHSCTNDACSAFGKPMKKVEANRVVVFTVGNEVRPAYSVHLTCRDCWTNYHHDYSVHKGIRAYYGTLRNYLQVSEHQFVEIQAIKLWISSMLCGNFSATNCARTYDLALSGQGGTDDLERAGWQFGTALTHKHIWHAFTLFTLFNGHQRRGDQLLVPHTGRHSDRFNKLMQEENRRIVNFGQDSVRHYCNKCTRVIENEDGSSGVVVVAVGDGVYMGHCRCGYSGDGPCTIPLTNVKDRFCSVHKHLEKICAIKGCTQPTKPGSKACSSSEHQAIERSHISKHDSFFVSKEKLQNRQAAHPDVVIGEAPMDIDENDEQFIVANDGQVRVALTQDVRFTGIDDQQPPPPPCHSKPNLRTTKATFNRLRTHNEETLVRPCGVICGRASMYDAEAVSNFLHFVRTIFSVPGALKPNVLVYDAGCRALQTIRAHPNDWQWFDDVSLIVDVFHFLHKHNDKFCRENLNPAIYEHELTDPITKRWFFNTSIAEQVNVWLGGYASMCREMTEVRYNFFLNEMVRLKNLDTIARLEAAGHDPRWMAVP